jgi:hypothetical protein
MAPSGLNANIKLVKENSKVGKHTFSFPNILWES